MCKECGKTLAVPNEAMHLTKPKPKPKPKPAPQEKIKPIVDPVALPNEGEHDGEVLVVARASMPAVLEEDVPHDDPKTSVQPAEQPLAPAAQQKKSDPQPQTKSPSHSIASVPIFGRMIEWVIAIPVGFFVVVILPRLFGFGFHASDFVDVITTQGIGRYGVVFKLILFWSIATVICVSIFNILIRKFLDARKVPTKQPTY